MSCLNVVFALSVVIGGMFWSSSADAMGSRVYGVVFEMGDIVSEFFDIARLVCCFVP